MHYIKYKKTNKLCSEKEINTGIEKQKMFLKIKSLEFIVIESDLRLN